MIYPHEHLALDLSGKKNDLDCRLDQKETIVEEFCGLRDRGVTLVADLTNRGMGRDVAVAREIGARSGVEVLHATGWYKEGFFPEEVYGADLDALAAVLLREIEQGIDGALGCTKASVIGEIGAEVDRITTEEERIFAAAARVQARTGVPIVTHATLGRMGHEQIELLQSHGANLSKTLISHVDLTNDLEYILRLTDRGVLVGFDTIGKAAYLDDAFRVQMLKALSQRGRCGSVVLSMDITRRSHLKRNGGVGYAYLTDAFLPRLRVADTLGPAVPEKDITAMTQTNAERLYGRPSP